MTTTDRLSKKQSALARAHLLGELSAQLNFDWHDAREALKKIREEIDELEEAIIANDRAHAQEELGDLLFATAQVARHLNIEAEVALHRGNEKFLTRFQKLLALAGGEDEFKSLDPKRMDELWQHIKTTYGV